ncbi:hypothetical protein [Dyella acidiphila]|uniref:DUF4019 domain-containing protein n=1 Tax=Dyella acidiphila TaxID=2775866 RepID=A0ABR9GCL3_9GAMM|nr:hypothetical protein [Dyella acidiphila]MBE1161768.1 hypothetical protein [Dyella acidiphila]
MRRFLSVLGVVFLAIIVVACGIFGYLGHVRSGLDASSKAFVDTSIPLIAATWSKDDLLNRASVELKQSAESKPREFQAFFLTLAKLGALKKYEGSRGGANVFLETVKGKVVTASYIAEATMEHGEVYFAVRLVQRDGEWQFQSFDVKSPAFAIATTTQDVTATREPPAVGR